MEKNTPESLKALVREVTELEIATAQPSMPFTLNRAKLTARIAHLKTLSRSSAPSGLTVEQPAGIETPPVPAKAAVAIAAKISPAIAATPKLGITADEWRAMDVAQERKHCSMGGAMLKSAFDALTPAEKSSYCRMGGKLVDDAPEARRSVRAGDPMADNISLATLREVATAAFGNTSDADASFEALRTKFYENNLAVPGLSFAQLHARGAWRQPTTGLHRTAQATAQAAIHRYFDNK